VSVSRLPVTSKLQVRYVRIFVSSPSDVAEERRRARAVIERLGKEALFRGNLKLDPILWDDPEAPVPMLANLAPQESVNRVACPSECDIVVTILWGRMGTPLDQPLRSDGTRYLSGTEWEYEDALRAGRNILLFRRTAPVIVAIDDPLMTEKRDQKGRVDQFFATVAGSYRAYEQPREFAAQLESSLRNLLVELVQGASEKETYKERATTGERLESRPQNQTRLHNVRCFGRARELEILTRRVLRKLRRPVGIFGGPGIGKSTIAQALMRRPEILKRFNDDILFVRCDAVRSAEVLAQTLCRELGVEPTEDESARLVFFRELRDDPTLIIVDNLETPWESDRENTEVLLQLLAETPNVSLVVTMRGNEPPSGANWSRSLHVPPLDLRAARRLFLDEAKNPELSHDELLDPLLRLLDGVPLALVLVANNTHGEDSLSGVMKRWTKGTSMATRTIVDDERKDSLNASFELSLKSRRMTPQAMHLLSILAILPDGIRHFDLEAILPGDGDEAAARLRMLALAFDEADRLRLLSPVREYVRGRALCSETEVGRVMTFYRDLLIEYGVKASPEGAADCTERLQPELRNIEASIEHALVAAPAAAVAASLALAHVMRYTGFGTTTFLEKVLNASA